MNLERAQAVFRRLYFSQVLVISLLAVGCDSSRDKDSQQVPPPTEQTGTDADQQTKQGVTNEVDRDEDWFRDWTPASQVDFRYSTGRDSHCFTILETVGGGVTIVDYDVDSRPDIFGIGGGTIDAKTSVPSGSPCGLFRNLDGIHFRNVTKGSLLTDETDYSHGCVSGDLNRDGFPDLLVTCYGHNCLLVNQGDGTFLDETKSAGLHGPHMWSTAAAFGDVNQDGELDIYIAGYVDWTPSAKRPSEVPPPQDYHPTPDRLYLNTGDGRFVDATEIAGIRSDGMGMGVIAADINDDRRVDFYVANDVVENHLYLGADAFPLPEVAGISGTSVSESGRPEGSMGVDCADVNGDGRADLFTTNFEMEDNSLYINLGGTQFLHSTTKMKLAGTGRPFVKFGTGLRDFDGDGWLDLFFVNGHVRYQKGLQPFLQPPTLCRNQKGTGFVEITSQGGAWFRTQHAARGTATGDLDGDGGLDLVITSLTEPLTILHNQHPARNWCKIKLVGRQSPRTPIGCRLSLQAFGRNCVYFVTSGSGYLSHSEDSLLMAVEPERTSAAVLISWPSGRVEQFSDIPLHIESVLVEGRGQETSARPQQ